MYSPLHIESKIKIAGIVSIIINFDDLTFEPHIQFIVHYAYVKTKAQTIEKYYSKAPIDI
jgi:hypothetical protein